ncbi:urea transporter [Candidatus Curtissbacteria bacterium]|nr:urea transporter [Candidatus Curtissbacteria bacterium]
MNYIAIILKGFSHVFFQESILLGLVIVGGLAMVSPIALLLALVGNITGFFTSTLLGVKKPIVELGIYGFNGVLIGCMVAFYVKQLPMAVVITIVTSALAAAIFYLFFRNQIPAFALPFTLMGWLILMLLKYFK